MKFVEVKEVPEKRCGHHNIGAYMKEFMAMNIKVAKVELNVRDYKKPKYAASSFIDHIKRNGLPIDVCMRKDEVYLIRRDM